MSQDTRKDKRAQDTSIVVRYKSATVDEFIEHHAHDVSRGGIFVKTTTPFGPGTLLKFELRISDDKPLIAGVGRVVWKRDPAQVAEGRPSGMGVKFIKIDEPSRVLIDEVVSKAPSAGASFTNGESRKEPANAPAPPSVVTSAPPIAALGRTPSAGAPVLPTPAATPAAEPKRIPPPPSRVPAPPSRGVTVPSPKTGGGLAPPPQRGNSERPTIAGMPVSAPAAPEPTPAPKPVAANAAPAAGTPARDSTRDLLKDPPRPVVRVTEEVKTVRRSLDSLLSEIETDTVSKTTKDVPVTAPGEPVPAAPPRATFAAARKQTIMGMATPPPPAAERTSQMPAQPGATPPPAATMTFGDVPSRASEGEDRPEPTVMKQAAELLEEALREAGGSLDDIGNNPLFGGVTPLGKQPHGTPGRDAMLTPVGDPLGMTTPDDDGLEHQERTLAMSRDAVKREFSSTMPLNKPDPALASTMLSQSQPPPAAGQPPAIAQQGAISPSAPPPAFAQPPARVSTPPAAEKKKGSALPLVLGLGVLVLLAGGGVGAWKMGYLNSVLGGGKPIPTAAPSLASATPTVAPTIANTAAPPASASAIADTAIDAGAAVDASVAAASDASAAAALPGASATPTATASAAPTQPKIVYRPPPPRPTATDDTPPTPPATAAAPTATAAPAPTATAAPAPTAAAPTATAAPKPPALVPGDDLNLK